MPHKFNADRRDKIPKQKQRVTNWAEYNEGLRRRASRSSQEEPVACASQ
jgi:hypothetical protein